MGHPWPLTVEHTEVPGASGYEVEVEQDSTTYSLASQVSDPDPLQHEVWIYVHASGQSRVRALGPTGVAGAWSAWVPFFVSDLAPSGISPTDYDLIPADAVRFTFSNNAAFFGDRTYGSPYDGPRVANHTVDLWKVTTDSYTLVDSYTTTYTPSSSSDYVSVDYPGILPPGDYRWYAYATSIKGDHSMHSADHFFSTALLNTGTPCNTTVQSGGEAYEMHEIELGQTSGTLEFHYDTINVPDIMEVWYEGSLLKSSGCWGSMGWGWDTIDYQGSSTKISVIVYPHCDPAYTYDTLWSFMVKCPE